MYPTCSVPDRSMVGQDLVLARCAGGTGPGSLLKARLRKRGTRRPYKRKQPQGRTSPGGLKLGVQYQCLTTWPAMPVPSEHRFRVHPAGRPIVSPNPCPNASQKQCERSPSRGFGHVPGQYLTYETAFGARQSWLRHHTGPNTRT
jgi:hypothetical protein